MWLLRILCWTKCTNFNNLIVYKDLKKSLFGFSDKAQDTKTLKNKDEKIKQNKTVELLRKSEEEMPKRRRSPRLIPTSNGANSLVASTESKGTKKLGILLKWNWPSVT